MNEREFEHEDEHEYEHEDDHEYEQDPVYCIPRASVLTTGTVAS